MGLTRRELKIRKRIASPHPSYAVLPVKGKGFFWCVWESWDTDTRPVAKGFGKTATAAEESAKGVCGGKWAALREEFAEKWLPAK